MTFCIIIVDENRNTVAVIVLMIFLLYIGICKYITMHIVNTVLNGHEL